MGNTSDEITLAVTSVGKLLLENCIACNGTTENDIIKDVKLCIPNYQRPYKWRVKNVLQLVDDIMEAKFNNKEIYRVGTLILYNDKDGKAHNNEYEIVDGQQRTTTFCLLLKALLKAQANEEKETHGKESQTKEPEFLNQEIEDNPYSINNLINNYRALERKVSVIPDKKSFLDYVNQRCEFIVVITDDLSEAFQFFDSQNARGKKLYPHDLLKAYHLREMNNLDTTVTERVVKDWEDLNQSELSSLFSEYLYRLKEWVKGNRAEELSEHNIDKFKGITRQDNFPYSQFFKGAFSYADMVNNSSMPFVSGMRDFNPFQITTPIIAGKPFFDYAKHYFNILKDVQNNDKFEGYYINDNEIVKTLDLRQWKKGVGNWITRLLFDTAILLYIDRFCPEKPSKNDNEMLDQFVIYAFIWSYSLRAQYRNLGWLSAQNYIMKNDDKQNSFNIYKMIAEANSPSDLLGSLEQELKPLELKSICDRPIKKGDGKILVDDKDIDEKANGVFINYHHFFKEHNFLTIQANS